MAGGSHKHVLISMNVSGSSFGRLRGKPCRVINSDQRVKVEATGLHTYPDVSVFCEDARFGGKHDEVLLNPKVIIEVLSPSTEAYDRGGKWAHHKQLESLSDYVLISQDYVQVEHYRRLESNDWLLHTATKLENAITLESIDCELALLEVYDGVELPQSVPLRTPIADS